MGGNTVAERLEAYYASQLQDARDALIRAQATVDTLETALRTLRAIVAEHEKRRTQN